MVEDTFKEKLIAVCNALEQSKGTVYLLAALKMDELTEKWTLVVSSEWVNDAGFDEAFTEVRSKLLESFDNDISQFVRIGIFNTNEHIVELIMQKYKSGDVIKEDTQINGNLIHEGYIVKTVDESPVPPR